jgi:hypothetical protein
VGQARCDLGGLELRVSNRLKGLINRSRENSEVRLISQSLKNFEKLEFRKKLQNPAKSLKTLDRFG